MVEKIYGVIVIGSGPAGLTAAIYTGRGGASTLVIGGEAWGGQLMMTTEVDNFPGFPEGIMGPVLMANMRKQAERFGAGFVEKNAESIKNNKSHFEIKAGGETYLARSIIVATGAAAQWLELDGIEKLIGRGIASCAPCDAPFFRNKKVAVVGGGDSAMEEALVLTKYASEVFIIHRKNKFRASMAMQKKVLDNPKIKILWNSEVVKVIGEKKLEKVIVFNNQTKKEEELALDGLFVAIGHKPESDIFKGIVATDEKGYIVIQNGSKTNVPGIFVSGGVHDYTYKQAVTAAGYGCQAGMEALKYLGK
ncbi:MAG: thioredoxin-disulfide reductase [bacterium]|nr:thioredoxin-disulfide reductase [bacterium]